MGQCTGKTAVLHKVTHLHMNCHLGFVPLFNFMHVVLFCQVCDLAQALRDGVLLCQLLNNLLPQAVNLREINLRPQMSQVTCRQIFTYLISIVTRTQCQSSMAV